MTSKTSIVTSASSCGEPHPTRSVGNSLGSNREQKESCTFSNPSSVSRRSALIAAALAAVALGCGWAGTTKAAISGGFSNPGNWVLNGNSTFVPFMSGGDLTLTTGQNGENTSAWYTTQQDVGDSWTANFTWQLSVPSNPPADGFMFVVACRVCFTITFILRCVF